MTVSRSPDHAAPNQGVASLSSVLTALSHPLRHALTEEMHVRVFPSFTAPAQIIQLVLLVDPGNGARDRQHAEALCVALGAATPNDGRYFVAQTPDLDFVWEQHTEFSTYSFIRSGAFDIPFTASLLDQVPVGWLGSFPGRILRGTQIAILNQGATPPSDRQLADYFRLQDLVSCSVHDGAARIWADFRLHEDGFGRMLIQDLGLSKGDLARLVQRLQELGNYRKVALLGLPVAQRLTPTVSDLERQLAMLSRHMAEDQTDDNQLLKDLSILSAELARIIAETRYRMSATKAYAELVSDRLRSLNVGRISGYQTLLDFTERRLTPAVRTCESFSRRLDDLSVRAGQATALLRTRIDTVMERQSRDLLASMNRRTRLQLRLQQTVEGLSVVAISYYLVGLLGYSIKSLQTVWPQFDPIVAIGVAAPLVVFAVWFLLRRLRHRFKDDDL